MRFFRIEIRVRTHTTSSEYAPNSPALETVDHMIGTLGIEIRRNDRHACQGTQTAKKPLGG